MAEAFVYGPNPVAGVADRQLCGGTLMIDVSNDGATMQLQVPVTVPSGAGLFPGIINHLSTGSLMAWAWGASRIIDALELTTGHNIDSTKISAVGCSRNGKAAATIGLFDERFAMVAARTPGSGTTSAWRIAYDEMGDGANVQTAAQIFRENTWLGEVLLPFAPPENAPRQQRTEAVQTLPIDQHVVLALAWPRPLIMMEGTNDSWNCPLCSFETLSYTRLIYDALGTSDALSFPQPATGHCARQGTFADQFFATFVHRFLRGDESVSTAGLFDSDTNFTFDTNRWQDGEIPELQ